jgi:hypothetical protein
MKASKDSSESLTSLESEEESSFHSSIMSNITNETDATCSTIKPKKKHRVQFSNIEMRFYNRILGDNPAVEYGPPIQLDWSYNDQNIFLTSIDEYETHRLPRRTRRQLAMSEGTRWNLMIHQFGYTHDEITECANKVKKIKKQREKSKMTTIAGEKRQEFAEKVLKSIKINLKPGKDKMVKKYTKNSSIGSSSAYSLFAQEENTRLNQFLMMST